MNDDQVSLIKKLRELDRDTTKGAFMGDAECVWYYMRDDIEGVLGVPRGTLDTGMYNPEENTEDD